MIDTSITIGGSRVTDMPSIKVIRSLSENNATSSFVGNLNNYAGYNTNKYQIGDEVRVFAMHNGSSWVNGAGSGLLFAGVLEDIKYVGEGVQERIELSGKDYACRLTDRTVEPEVYNGLSPGSIVKDIVSKYTTNLTTSQVNISTGSINRIRFNQTPVFDAIKQLADFQDIMFYVDENKDLFFGPKGGSSSGYTLNNTNVLKGQFKQQRDTAYNQIWVYGDRYLDGFKETFTAGDPVGGSVFTLLYNPHNTQVTVSGAIIQPGGVYQMVVSAGSNLRYLVSYEDKQIIFTSGTVCGANIPASGNSVVVDYKRLLPIVKVGDAETSKSKYSQRNKIIVDKNIKDPKTAEMILKSELDQNTEPLIQGQVLVDGIANIVPGRTVIVDLPNHNINNQTFNVIESSYNITKEDCLHDHILTVKLNRKLPDITDTIKDMMLQLKKIQSADINDSDVITRYQSTTGSLGIRAYRQAAYSEGIGSSFILGHPVNSLLGSYANHSLGRWSTGSTLKYVDYPNDYYETFNYIEAFDQSVSNATWSGGSLVFE